MFLLKSIGMNQLTNMIANFFLGSKEMQLSKLNLAVFVVQK